MVSSTEAEEAVPPDLSSFVYSPLDRSKNQFRLLSLAPGDPDDEVTATIRTYHLSALPSNYNHEVHLSELETIHEDMLTAARTSEEVRIEELLSWERLYAELSEHYWITTLKNTPVGERTIPIGSNMKRLRGMRDRLFDDVQQHQDKSSNSCEVDALQALINCLERIFSGKKAREMPDFASHPTNGYTAVVRKPQVTC